MPYPELPAGWELVSTRGLGPFATAQTFRRPDGSTVTWTSRRARKRPRSDKSAASTWWAPRSIGWWIGVLFAIGSTLFAVGAVPPYAIAVGAFVDGLTFFIGSLFFTTAGFLVFLEAASAPRTADRDEVRIGRRVLVFEPTRIDWWASLIQFVGTILFNINTFRAMISGLDSTVTDQQIWRPDAIGSVCFLVASLLCYFEVCSRWLTWRPRLLSWWIGLLNLIGSFFFGVSAVASYVVPTTGELRNMAWTNLGTFLGALCFLTGAILLLPERTREEETVDPRPAATDRG